MAFIWTPLLETMSAAARTAWPHIQRAAALGLQSEEVIASLKEAGIATFRRQDMLALIREASGAELLKSDIARWPANTLFPITRVRESVTKIVAPFSYTLRVSARDVETGEDVELIRQAHSEQLLSADEIADLFMNSAEGREPYETLELLAAQVTDIQRAGSAGSL